MRVLVTGASGLIGKNFIRQALQQGSHVHALVRNSNAFKMLSGDQVFSWSHNGEFPEKSLDGIEAVVHLAGENIAEKRWSIDQKKRLVESRVVSTRKLVEAFAKQSPDKRPKVFVSGSAIGFYGYEQDSEVDESSPVGNDFLADLCQQWETEARAAEKLGIRVVLLRTGIVLSREGGALEKMPPVQISNGQAWMSWIHIQDMCRIISFALSNKTLSGPVNCVSENPVRNKEFIKELANIKGVPNLAIVPSSAIKFALGELSNAILSSLKVKPAALIKAGFKFDYPDLKSALRREFYGTEFFDSFYFKDQFVPLKPEEIFHFFAKAENLETLTPPWLNFKIVGKTTDNIQKGTCIDYKLKIHGLPVFWKTLISEWKMNEYFVDEQLKGPYSKWHHTHSFVPVPGGCLIRDEIVYRVPMPILGNLFLSRWIRKDVSQIFEYRQSQIQKLLETGGLN